VIRAEPLTDDQLLIRTFNFPGWTATVDGNPVALKTAEDLGDIEIDLTAGAHLVTLDFRDTPVRSRFRVVTLGTVGLMCVLTAASVVKRKSSSTLDSE